MSLPLILTDLGAPAGAECGSIGPNWNTAHSTCLPGAEQAVLTPSGVPDPFQGLGPCTKVPDPFQGP